MYHSKHVRILLFEWRQNLQSQTHNTALYLDVAGDLAVQFPVKSINCKKSTSNFSKRSIYSIRSTTRNLKNLPKETYLPQLLCTFLWLCIICKESYLFHSAHLTTFTVAQESDQMRQTTRNLEKKLCEINNVTSIHLSFFRSNAALI